MKRILFYTIFLTQGGGIEVATINYMKELIKEGYKVDLYVDYNMGKDNIREKEIKKISKEINIKYLKSEKISKIIYKLRTLGKRNRIFNFPMYFLIILSDYFIWKKELKIIEKIKYDTTITFFQFLPSYITKLKGPTHLIFLHGAVSNFFIGIRKYFKNSYLKKLKKYNYVCTVSQGIAKELIEFFPILKGKERIVYNPIEFDLIENKSKDISELVKEEEKLIKESYICSVGRLDEKDKDFTTLIKAFNILIKENNVKEKLFLIGDGPDKLKLEGLVKELGIASNVKFLGKKTNPYIWMKNSRLFVLSSKSEGFGLVLLEALFLGKKVISSDCPVGPKEILKNGKYGSLFTVGDIEGLSKLLKEKLLEKELENAEEIKKYILSKFVNKIF
ncbi:glycosyltransferase [Fusobacterium sp.]|uniref:glycosyltransferase n=1 Tax=Fusobacterium sp. TaxID=68766 RepID=UPI00261B01E0|nr:glycosyltransferase [Fusobacterium sp.]